MSWKRTDTDNLVRHQNGTYYARPRENGKQVWRSLETKISDVARMRLRVALDEMKSLRMLKPPGASAAGAA